MITFAYMRRLTGILILLASWFCAAAQDQARDAYSVAEEQFYQGQYSAAIMTALEGLNQEPARSSEEAAVELFSILGASYSRLGDFEAAASYFVRCYEFDKANGDPKGLTSSLINLASMYVYAGKPELGEKYALEAIETEKTQGRPAKLAMAYGKACDIYHAMGQEETALEYADLAVSSAREAGDDVGIAVRRSQRAYPLAALKRDREAWTDLRFAEKIFREENKKQSLAIVCFQIAQQSAQMGRKQSATQYYEEAKALAAEIQDKPLLQKICARYAQHLSDSDPSQALSLMKEATSIQEEIEKSKSSNALELFNIKFETAKREQTIATQKLELEKRRSTGILLSLVILFLLIAAAVTTLSMISARRKEKKLRQLNAQKDFLFKVISHDILSPAIAQLRGIQMLSKHSEKLSQAQYKEALTQLEGQAESEVELIENVLRWAKSKGGKIKEGSVRFAMADMVKEAIGQYQSMAEHKGISLLLDDPENIIVCCNRSNLLLALRNLLSNAIKFSRPGGDVRISIAPTARGADLSVADSGIGIPAGQINSIFDPKNSYRRSGTAGEPSNGLGLIVSRDLVKAIGGSLSVSSEEGKGCTFTIHIENQSENA